LKDSADLIEVAGHAEVQGRVLLVQLDRVRQRDSVRGVVALLADRELRRRRVDAVLHRGLNITRVADVLDVRERHLRTSRRGNAAGRRGTRDGVVDVLASQREMTVQLGLEEGRMRADLHAVGVLDVIFKPILDSILRVSPGGIEEPENEGEQEGAGGRGPDSTRGIVGCWHAGLIAKHGPEDNGSKLAA
jgi:hypothetical protein